MSKQFSKQDYQFMTRAIQLARQGMYTTSPNPNVGCVIVKDGQIIGEGFHQRAGTGHAEVNAIAHARENNQDTAGAVAYVTLEPCSHFGRTPPCAEALKQAKVASVIAAMVDPNPVVSGRGLTILEEAGIDVSHGLLEQDAKAINTGFITLMKTKLPFVRCKLATSLDGKTAMASGESQWITGTEAREDVQRLRAQSCAVITGADSVLFDNARMTVRHEELGQLRDAYAKEQIRQPVRIVIDSQNRLTPDMALFSIESPVIIIGTGVENIQQWPHFVEHVQVKPGSEGKADLNEVLTYLGSQGYRDILVEAGARLSGAFIEQDLVDELIHYQAPKLMGGDGMSMVNFPNIVQLADAKTIHFTQVSMVGGDLKITAQLSKS